MVLAKELLLILRNQIKPIAITQLKNAMKFVLELERNELLTIVAAKVFSDYSGFAIHTLGLQFGLSLW